MSVGKNSISRISAGTAPKKKAPAKPAPELTPAAEEIKTEVAAPAPAKKQEKKEEAPREGIAALVDTPALKDDKKDEEKPEEKAEEETTDAEEKTENKD